MKYIIQIGSHIGNTVNDPIYKTIDKDTFLILVEPVPYLFEQLKTNYLTRFPNSKNIIFINKAVSNFVGEIEMTIPSLKNNFNKFPFWATQISSINPVHVKTHIPSLITEKIKVPTTTLNDIIKDYHITELDLLHTDTEGHDYEILMDYTFSIKPKRIMFEHKHMDGVFKIGARYQTLLNKLEGLGYSIHSKTVEDTIMQLR